MKRKAQRAVVNKLDIEAIRKVILSNAEQVNYRPERHQYFMDEAEAPSVSKLLRPITDEELRNIPQDRLEMARERGVAVHEAIDRYLDTGFDMSKGETALYMAQFKRCMAEHRIIVIANEVKLRNVAYWYCGRGDIVGIVDDEPIIRPIDVKVTYEINASVVIQLNLYENCLLSYIYNDAPLPVGEGKVLHLELEDYQFVGASDIADRAETVAAARGLVAVNTFRSHY
jgi:hypothetical protein